MGACCGHSHGTFDGMSKDYRRRLWLVIALNGGMFIVEMIAGQAAGSKALQADALDFFGDAVTYGISLAVIGASLKTRALAALAKGTSLFLMGVWVAATTLYQVFVLGVPQAAVMGSIGFLALAVNLASVLLLVRYKDGDANVRSVWLCSRNDVIGNLGVILSGGLVVAFDSFWPDILVASVVAAVFLHTACTVLRDAGRAWRHGAPASFDSCR